MIRAFLFVLFFANSAIAENWLGAKEQFYPGQGVVVESQSEFTTFAAVFEDDGTTGYFYGLDFSAEENPILDALHIYNAENVSDSSIESEVKIIWSEDGARVALLLNDYPHAVFDFVGKRGYCRTGFPPPSDTWSTEGHEWDDQALSFFDD